MTPLDLDLAEAGVMPLGPRDVALRAGVTKSGPSTTACTAAATHARTLGWIPSLEDVEVVAAFAFALSTPARFAATTLSIASATHARTARSISALLGFFDDLDADVGVVDSGESTGDTHSGCAAPAPVIVCFFNTPFVGGAPIVVTTTSDPVVLGGLTGDLLNALVELAYAPSRFFAAPISSIFLDFASNALVRLSRSSAASACPLARTAAALSAAFFAFSAGERKPAALALDVVDASLDRRPPLSSALTRVGGSCIARVFVVNLQSKRRRTQSLTVQTPRYVSKSNSNPIQPDE
jgi:hypothetical protein